LGGAADAGYAFLKVYEHCVVYYPAVGEAWHGSYVFGEMKVPRIEREGRGGEREWTRCCSPTLEISLRFLIVPCTAK